MSRLEDELFDEGDALLQRRAEVEAAIGRYFPGSRAALLVQAAKVERERERLRVELQRLVHEVDDVDADEDEAEDEAASSGFYAARERLVVRDRELIGRAEALQRRAAQPRRSPTPAKLAELEREREQLEAKIRQWRGRCRQAGLRLDLPRWGEFAGSAEDD